ncbi:Pga5 [Symbiodinium natans]|uniref:Pga5 protein n=1 Tax=Symbiodinium natans TaxID=878477 RepID=A0A812QHB2_9DINO|nr:Pga5 [Symbiodinium natans]
MRIRLRLLDLLAFCQVLLSRSLKTRAADAESCAPLINRQSYSALRVGVGTPKQEFDLVADTGSSTVIVTHCECRAHACFGSSGKCFTGTNRSSTFRVPRDASGSPMAVTMAFGSGIIYGVVGSDLVTVGQESAMMNSSVVFMYDHELATSTSDFEGIFGLGLPYKQPSASASHEQSWLVRAAIERFSMCFSNMQEDGMLRLNSPAQTTRLGNLGKFHWGLDFRGVSVGGEKADVILCGDGERKDKETACGLIPDSGTTLILAPSRHLLRLYAKLCDMWPRCSKAFAQDNATKSSNGHPEPETGSTIGDWIRSTLEKWGIPKISITNPFELDPASQLQLDKKERFESLLADCASWTTDAADLDREMPPIFWHVAGVEGTTQTFSLPASAYIVATGYKDHILCMPFFGEYDYETQLNGPIWIMGTPLFYEYEVHYDMSTEPASMSFSKTSCGSCGQDGKAAPSVSLLRRKNQRLRRHDAKVRMPHMNTSLPL